MSTRHLRRHRTAERTTALTSMADLLGVALLVGALRLTPPVLGDDAAVAVHPAGSRGAINKVDAADALTPLVTFDGSPGTTFSFELVNDPVMGGMSHSVFDPSVEDDGPLKYARWNGTVVDVPSLSAPGFCSVKTSHRLRSTFNDASGSTHLSLRVRSSTPEYAGFKVSFASIFTLRPTFASYKADFVVPPSSDDDHGSNEGGWEDSGDDDEWRWVDIPLTNFSNHWSAYTGEPTIRCRDDPSVCPGDRDLRHIKQITLWAEGVSAPFHIEVLGIYARTAVAATTTTPALPRDGRGRAKADAWARRREGTVGGTVVGTCAGPVQKDLRFNVSSFLANDVLPFGGFPKDESLAEAVCCDPYYAGYAEPRGFFARDDVNFFDRLDLDLDHDHDHDPTSSSASVSRPVTFYDPVCGIPLFVAPTGRTMGDFVDDTTEHGWPSFREEEVVDGNVIVEDGGRIVTSRCGTRLGTYEPDEDGRPRYCLDVACVSGNPAVPTFPETRARPLPRKASTTSLMQSLTRVVHFVTPLRSLCDFLRNGLIRRTG